MLDLENNHIINLFNEIIINDEETIPYYLAGELVEYLSDAMFFCPSDGNGGIVHLEIDSNNFIPACCDFEDYNMIFDEYDYELFEFKDFFKFLTSDVVAIIINPGNLGFVINKSLSRMVFNRIKSKNMSLSKKGYEVKVILNDFSPLTWRDLIIPENITFKELDDILKTLWGFEGYHLSAFTVPIEDLIIIDENLARQSKMDCDYDINNTLINELFDEFMTITYWYDFGDNWLFDIEIKDQIDYDKNYVKIKQFEGKYNPIEDCKGVSGLREIVFYAEHPEKKDSSYFCELAEDLTEFDMEYTQKLLKDKNYVNSFLNLNY